MASRSERRGVQPKASPASLGSATNIGGSPGAPGPFAKGHGAGRYFPHRPDNLTHGVTLPCSQVQRTAFSSARQVFQRPHVGVRQVCDMNVVADGGTVRGGIIRAINLDIRPMPERRLDGERNEVSFRVVAFAQFAVRIRPRRIEISQGNPSHLIGVSVPLERALHGQLGFAIRIYGFFGVILGIGTFWGLP